MNSKEIFRDYLNFSRRERIALLAITGLILLVFCLPLIINNKTNSSSPVTDTTWIASARNLDRTTGEKNYQHQYRGLEGNDFTYQYDPPEKKYSTSIKAELFYFDPNTLSPDGWERLGLRKKTIGTIGKYLSKGGRFKSPEDLKRIYGLFPDEYKRIAPYIRIASPDSAPDEYKQNTADIKTAKTYMARYTAVEINLADTSALIALPGIGSKLASRIITFREKLGGFYSIDQVGETFGLADSTFQKIKQYLKIEVSVIKKINVNTATADELKSHPYIRYTLAYPIVAYRTEHGGFTKLEDLKKVMAVTEVLYTKISPYLTL